MRWYTKLMTVSVLFFILFSCGKSDDKIQQARSLSEAKTLATETGTFIVVDFWRHG